MENKLVSNLSNYKGKTCESDRLTLDGDNLKLWARQKRLYLKQKSCHSLLLPPWDFWRNKIYPVLPTTVWEKGKANQKEELQHVTVHQKSQIYLFFFNLVLGWRWWEMSKDILNFNLPGVLYESMWIHEYLPGGFCPSIAPRHIEESLCKSTEHMRENKTNIRAS